MNPDVDPMVCLYPIWDGLLVDFSFDIAGIEWALMGVVILCGVPASPPAGWQSEEWE